MSDALAKEIVPLIVRYVGYSKTMDFAAKRALWDADDPAPLLMPEEADEARIGWDAMEGYWSQSRTILASLESATRNHICRLIAPNIALVTYDMRWIVTLPGKTTPLGGDVRVTALLRRKPEGWRFFHLVEGPVDMMAMARQAAEWNVRG